MLDVKLLREDIAGIAEKLKKRGYKFDILAFQKLEDNRKSLQTELQQAQNKRNNYSKKIGQAKAHGEVVEAIMHEVSNLGEEIKLYEQKLEHVQKELDDILMYVPNIPHDSVPYGNSEQDNVGVRRWREPTKFNFKIKKHDELGEYYGGIDFQISSQLSGSRFVVLKGDFARLHRALAQFMLDLHVEEHGYQEVLVPCLVKPEILYGTGQFPKFMEDQFGVRDDDLWLIPTSEVPVVNLVREQILEADQLPLKFVCYSACFRREAGSYGKDTHGMIRRHQFEKVELVQITKPSESYKALEEITNQAEKVLQLLELPYRVVTLCTGDMGFAAAKTYDLEVWMPGENKYREISSCSNTEDFQARRMKARWRENGEKKTHLVHTLNGSGLPIGRTLIAVVENYQDEQGRIQIPRVLQPYMNGLKVIER